MKIKYNYYLSMIFSLFACSIYHQKEVLIDNFTKNPMYNFIVCIDENISDVIKNKILSDIKVFTRVKIINTEEFINYLQKNSIKLDELNSKDFDEIIFKFPNAHFIALFKHIDNKIKYRSYNLLNKISEEFEIEEFVLYENHNWLLDSKTGWLNVQANINNIEVYINYELKGYTPLLINLQHGDYNIKLVNAGTTLFTKEITVPFTTRITAEIEKNMVKQEKYDELELEREDKNQSIFIAIVVGISTIAGILIPFIIF